MRKTVPIKFSLALLMASTTILGCTQSLPNNPSQTLLSQNNHQANYSAYENSYIEKQVSSSTLIEPVTRIAQPEPVINQEQIQTKSSSTTDTKDALTAIHEDELIFQDSETLFEEGGFSIMSHQCGCSEVKVEGKFSYQRKKNYTNRDDEQFEQERISRTRSYNQRFARNYDPPVAKRQPPPPPPTRRYAPDNFRPVNTLQTFLSELKNSGAVEFQPDGTIIISPDKVHSLIGEKQQKVKQKVNQYKENIEYRNDHLQNYLSGKKRVDREQLRRIKQKNVDCNKSDVVTLENDDGTITKTVEFEFINEKTGATKVNKHSRTFSADGTLIRKEHYLTVKIGDYNKTSTRIIEINGNETKITYESKTIWANGKTREIYEERTGNHDGVFRGNGSIRVRKPNGRNISCNLQTEVNSDGEITTTADDIVDNTEVVVVSGDNGDTTSTTIDTDGTGTTEVVDTEQASENEENVDAEETEVVDNNQNSETEAEITLCHQPGTAAEQTKVLPEPAVQAHLDHGDTLGACEVNDDNDNAEKNNNGLGDQKDDDNTEKFDDASNPGQGNDNAGGNNN